MHKPFSPWEKVAEGRMRAAPQKAGPRVSNLRAIAGSFKHDLRLTIITAKRHAARPSPAELRSSTSPSGRGGGEWHVAGTSRYNFGMSAQRADSSTLPVVEAEGEPRRKPPQTLSPSPKSVLTFLLMAGFLAKLYFELERATFLIFVGALALLAVVDWRLRAAAIRHLRSGGGEAPIQYSMYRLYCLIGGAFHGAYIGAFMGLCVSYFFGWPGFVLAMIACVVFTTLGELADADREIARAVEVARDENAPT
ncbi:MAG: hypothetical protein C0483_21355 [Pirellula sp.]|nr:hypothetical protein [Pirellula sp.]